ncbi:MAG TPA: NAD-dependent DNA ligase, partial [Spirochaetota bacterium]|nr:NAD-dependent DNA ligase [Spirochaetota bacterium]
RRGQVQDRVTEETDYLVVGSGGSPYWAFSCYGRKVERAMNLRRDGHPVSIVHESDFWDALG